MQARPILCCLNVLVIGFASTSIGVLFWFEPGSPRFPAYVPMVVSTFSVTSGFFGCVAQYQRACRWTQWAVFSLSFLLSVGVFLYMTLRKDVVVFLLLQSGWQTTKAASEVVLFCQITFFLMIVSQTAVVVSNCFWDKLRTRLDNTSRDAERPVGHVALTIDRNTDSTYSGPRAMPSCRIEISTTDDRVFRVADVSEFGAISGRFSPGSTSSGNVPWARDSGGRRPLDMFSREPTPMPCSRRAPSSVTLDVQVENKRKLANNSKPQYTPFSEEVAGAYSGTETVPDAEVESSSISSSDADADAYSVYSAFSDMTGVQSAPESPWTAACSADAKQSVKTRDPKPNRKFISSLSKDRFVSVK